MTKPHEAGADAGYNYLASAPLFTMTKPPGMAYVPGRVDALVGFEVYSTRVGNGNDLLAVYGDIKVADAARSYYLTAVNDDVNHAWPPRVRIAGEW